MGKKGNWFGAVKKVFSPESKEKKQEKAVSKSKHKWAFGRSKRSEPSEPPVPLEETITVVSQEAKFTEVEDEQNKHAYSVAIASAVAAEAAVASAQAAAEVVRLTVVPQPTRKSREEMAAIKIQTAFRGYLARRALRALRGLVRLKSLLNGNSVKRQATTALRCMQTLSRVQSQIRSRRLRMSEENQALQRQLLLKQEKELQDLKASMGEDWDDSLQSKEQIKIKLAYKQEAAIRRERALAYAFSHQQHWKHSSKSVNPMFIDPSNPHWGWSWLERWMAARPWESYSLAERENSDASSIRTASRIAGDIVKSTVPHVINGERPSPVTVKSIRPANRVQDDSRSLMSMQSERTRRHSIGGSSIRDDESLASSPSIPSYMTPTQSARAKAKLNSPLGDKLDSAEKASPAFAKKRLSFPSSDKPPPNMASPAAARRFSDPPKMESFPKDINIIAELHGVGNGSRR